MKRRRTLQLDSSRRCVMENKYADRYVVLSTYLWEIPDEGDGTLIKLLTKGAE